MNARNHQSTLVLPFPLDRAVYRGDERRFHICSSVVLLFFLGTLAFGAQSSGDALERGFLNPPDSAKPRVWWHWMSGNISKEGIKADLEWMKRVGIGGFQNFDAGLDTPQIVEKRLVYMTPEWKDAFKYATTLADQLGLEMAIAGSPGWSETGGPWVPPAQGMKKLVWSEIRVEGGRPFNGMLPKPPSTTGPFQNIGRGGRGGGSGAAATPEFYADSAVIAYRLPDSDLSMAELQPKVTSSGGQFDLGALTDGDLVKSNTLPAAPAGEKAWIQFEFAKPQAVRGLTLVTGGGGRGGGAQGNPSLEFSNDGLQFQVAVAIPAGRVAEQTISFPPVTARYFRVTFRSASAPGRGAGGGAGGRGGAGAGAGGGTPIAELVLHTGTRVNRFEEKAAFAAATGLDATATPAVHSVEAIRKADVLDLTWNMRPDGTLNWTPPPGRWAVLRMGYSLTGARNSPASPEATGLEVDKLNRAYVKAYLDHYLDQYKATVGPLMGKRGLQYMITDSWEAGVQNWTDDMIQEFAKRRGYDPLPWLPVLTGKVVESAEASDRFLWDFRKTIADLTTENHYEQISASLKQRGMGRYSESHESGRAFIGDGMEVKRGANIPMSAMWTSPQGAASTQFDADIRESASVAHIYGQNLVAAESLTTGSGAWAFYPELLKSTADRELAMGLNRFVLHTSVHQPSNDKIPGLGLGPYGQWFTRHETWAELALPWTTYLARSSYLLQQGRFVADILYFYGEDSNITALFANSPPAVPDGYNFDYINADALIHQLTVRNGRITTPSGMSYRLLAFDPGNTRHLSLRVLRKVRDLVYAGAVVVGPKPVASPSLSDDQAEFQAIADRLWGPSAIKSKGKVYGREDIGQVLAKLQAAPDFAYTKPQSNTTLMFVHRKLADGELYWVNNRNARVENLEATFRARGKAPELWHADTGKIEPASYMIAGTATTVPMRLEPNDAVFVVFRQAAKADSREVPQPVETSLATIDGAWQVSFQTDRGAPPSITLDTLSSWSQNADTGVKYFSGTGTYTKSIQAPADWFKSGARVWLDLGSVKNLAVVAVNGKTLGILWHSPWRVDVTDALKPGANQIEVKVTNLWVNRLIGDAQPDAPKKYTYTARQFYNANSPLLPSGLLGPVQVIRSALEQ